MDDRKWLKRKYPAMFNELDEFLDDDRLAEFRKRKYKAGRLIRPVWYVNLYPVGTVIMFKRSNPVRDPNYPMHHAVVRCDVGFTESGYHLIDLFEQDFEEIRR